MVINTQSSQPAVGAVTSLDAVAKSNRDYSSEPPHLGKNLIISDNIFV